MTTYYVRADGIAANKADAYDPTSATTSMNVSVFISESFIAGDIIEIHEQYGNMDEFILDGAKISGEDGSPVELRFQGQAVLSRSTAGAIISLNSGEWLTISGFRIENTSTSAGNGSAFQVALLTGLANENSINITDCHVVGNPTGDGYSQISGGGNDSHINYNQCTADSCGLFEPNESHQAFTAHNNAQTSILNDCIITNSVEGLSYVVGATCIMNGGSISGVKGHLVKADAGGSDITLNNVVLNADSVDCKLFSNTAPCSIVANNCTFNITEHNSNRSFIRDVLTINGGIINADSSTFGFDGLSGSVTSLIGVTINLSSMKHLVRTDDGIINIKNCTIDMTNLGSDSGYIAYINIGSNGYIYGNLFKNIQGTQTRIEMGPDGLSGYVRNNTVVNNTSGGRFFRGRGLPGALENNIFYNVNDVCDLSLPSYDNNCYFQSEDMGGNGSITSNPEFVDFNSGDYTLKNTSPCVGIGKKYWGNAPRPNGIDGEPYPDTDIDIGCYQSTYDMGHPSNGGYGADIMRPDEWLNTDVNKVATGKTVTFNGSQGTWSSVVANNGDTYSGLHILNAIITVTQGSVFISCSPSGQGYSYSANDVVNISQVADVNSILVEDNGDDASRFIGSVEFIQVLSVPKGLIYKGVKAFDWELVGPPAAESWTDESSNAWTDESANDWTV